MAKSGYKDVNVASYIKLRFSWTSGTQNVANNYTPISWKLQLISTNSSANINSSVAKDYRVVVDGKEWEGTNTIGLSGGATKTLASGTKNIYHNSNGTKTFDFSFSQEFAITYSGESIGTISGSGSGELDDIPRGSVLGTISNFTIGNAITIPITKYSSSFTDTLVISVGGTTIKTISGITNGASVSFTTSEINNIYSKLPSATSGTFTFKLTTKSGSTTIGTSTKTAKGTIPSSVKPSISSVSLVEYVEGIATTFGAYIQNKSRIKGTINASGGSGSSIESYNIKINGATYTTNTFTTGVLKTSGSNSCVVTIIDKRGRSTSTTTTFNVLAYTRPTISSFSVLRCDQDGTLNVEGAYAKINASATITSLSSKNSKTFKLMFKKKSESTWTTSQTYTSAYSYTLTNHIVANINVDSAYDFKIQAIDYFEEVEKPFSLSTAYTILDIKADGTGIAFGKVANEPNCFDVGFEKSFLGKTSYVGGRNDTSEKNMWFPSPNSGQYPHNSKIYGGNGTSPVAIGMWDSDKTLPIFQYFDGDDYRLKFGDDILLRWGEYDIEAVLVKVNASLSGRYRTKEGLLIQWGTISIEGGSGTPTSQNVVFPIAYKEIPGIYTSMVSTLPGTTVLGTGHGSDAKNGTTIYVTRINSANTSVRWLAIGFGV